jgi:hypothetical protein
LRRATTEMLVAWLTALRGHTRIVHGRVATVSAATSVAWRHLAAFEVVNNAVH